MAETQGTGPAGYERPEPATAARRRSSRDTRGGDDAERTLRLARGGLGYVQAVARRYIGMGLDAEELIAAGNLGLVKASLRFDPGRNVKFETYADWWIRKAILEALETLGTPVRYPRYRSERLRQVHRERAGWMARRGSEPTLDDLARATGLSAPAVEQLLGTVPKAVAIDEPRRGDDRTLHDSLADPNSVCPHTSLIRRDLATHLRRHLASLETRERSVISLRFGFDGDRPRTLREVAARLELSRERVRQIELRALLKIRRRF